MKKIAISIMLLLMTTLLASCGNNETTTDTSQPPQMDTVNSNSVTVNSTHESNATTATQPQGDAEPVPQTDTKPTSATDNDTPESKPPATEEQLPPITPEYTEPDEQQPEIVVAKEALMAEDYKALTPSEDTGVLCAAGFIGYFEQEDMMSAVDEVRAGFLKSIPEVSPYMGDEAYVIIPRYENTTITLRKAKYNDNGTLEIGEVLLETQKTLVIFCNTSDLYPNTEVTVSCDIGEVKLIPKISLNDGTIVLPEQTRTLTLKPKEYISAPDDSVVEEQYKIAKQAYEWFALAPMTDQDGVAEVRELDGELYARASFKNITKLSELDAYIRTIFTDEFAETLIGTQTVYKDIDDKLYCRTFNGTTSIYSGDEACEILREEDGSITYRVTTEVLDEDLVTVTGYEIHDFRYVNTEKGWRFANFELTR